MNTRFTESIASLLNSSRRLKRRLLLAPSLLLAVSAGAPAWAQAPAARTQPAPKEGFTLRPLATRPALSQAPEVLRRELGLGASDELRLLRRETDELGYVHERFQQYYQGVKVEHGAMSLHAKAGRVESLSGELLRRPAMPAVQPALSEAAALQQALRAVHARVYKWQVPGEERALKKMTANPAASYAPRGELVLVGDFRQPEATRPLVLAWKFNVYAQQPLSRELVYVDARTGQVVLRDAVIKHVNATGSGTTRYLGQRPIYADQFASGYRLRETVHGKGVVTLNAQRSLNLGAAVDFVDNDNNWTAAEYDNANFDNAALDAHVGAQVTQDYWTTVHGRDSFDDKGTILTNYVHFDDVPGGAGYENAFWNGDCMTYGDGATRFRPLTAVDVCGHEIGHAVCETTANLTYSGESGALNEGFSDIWGACVEYHLDPTKQTWLIGEDIDKQRPSLRSMSNPNAESQPDTYQGTFWYTGTGDNGGVHTNSGVLNFWFYLLSVGGSGTNDLGTAYSVSGITIQKAGKIAYRAERLYLTASSNYAAARKATMQAAIDLYGLGSAEVIATANAWRAVGLGEAAPTITNFTPTSGNGGTAVTITGTNLGTTYRILFNGVNATVATLTSTTSVTVIVPANATTGVISLTTPSGTATTGTNFTVLNPGQAPTITSYTPAAGATQGTAVTITGTNFTGATSLTFNGTAATYTVVNATTITTTVPVGATTGSLTVTTPVGSASTNFKVLPAITSFSPSSGFVGTTVTITGTTLTGALDVKFNGTYANSFTVVNATTITAAVPVGATTGLITVRTPSGTATSATNFTVTSGLVVDDFSPVRGNVGTAVTITGQGFTGATSVLFNGTPVASFTVASDYEIWTTVPTGATTGPITVTRAALSATSAGTFYMPITNDQCANAISVACGSSTPGTTVGSTHTGDPSTTCGAGAFTTATLGVFYKFVGVGGNVTVSTCSSNYDGLVGVFTGSCGAFTCVGGDDDGCGVSGGGSTVTFNSVLNTTYYIYVSGYVNGGVPATGDFTLTVSCANMPTVTSFNPTSGPVGTGVTITGTNFTGATAVKFNGTNATGVNVVNATTITANVAAGSTTGPVSVVTPVGTATSASNFTVTATTATSITSFTPTSGPIGTSVVITGANFTGATAVRFNGTNASSFVVNSATQITATVATGTTTGAITVVAPSGTATSATNFTVVPTAGALSFDGGDDYINVNYSLNQATLTLEAWVKPTAVTGRYYVISNDSPGSYGAGFGINNGQLEIDMHDNFLAVPAATFTVGAWTHVAVVYHANGLIRAYRNGVEVYNATPNTTWPSSLNGTAAFSVGRHNANLALPFPGEIDEVRVWSRSLSACEIQQHMGCGLAGTEPGLDVYYNFNNTNAGAGSPNATQTTATDLGGTAQNGTLFNFALTGATSNWTAQSASVSGTCTTYVNAAPTAVAQNLSITLNAAGTATITAAQVNNNSSDDCTPAASLVLSVSPSSFTCANLGANTVTLTVTDGNGASSTATATVTVSETPLTAVAQNVSVSANMAGSTVVTVAMVNNGSTLGCNGTLGLLGPERVVNGGFDANATGWTTANIDGNGGYRGTGGNPGGHFILNDNGRVGIDPTISQTLTGLTVGSTYVVRGSYTNIYNYGTVGTTAFAVDIDGTQVKTFVNPGVVWTPFSLRFTATAASQVLAFRGEINTTDIDISIDNISVRELLPSVSFTCANVGANSVTLAAVDAAGNSNLATATVTVLDNAPLNAAAQSISVPLGVSSSVTVTPAQVDNGSTGNCGSTMSFLGSELVVNGGFDANATGWTTANIDGNGGYRGTGGNPGGYFILNDNGNPNRDPYMQQTFSNMTVGAKYLISGTFLTLEGQNTNATGLSIDVNGASVRTYQTTGAAWVQFSYVLTATGATNTLRLRAEIGNDYNAAIDNVSVRQLLPNQTYTCSQAGSTFPVVLALTDAAGNSSTAAANVTVTVPPTATTTWNGSVDTDMTNCANWSYGKLPDLSTHVVIPVGMPRYPVVAAGATATMANLTVDAGASISNGTGSTIEVYGNYVNNSGVVMTGTIALRGAATQSINGSTSVFFGTLAVNKTGGSVQLQRAVTVNTNLSLSGAVLNTGAYRVVLGNNATVTETETSYVTGTVETTRNLNAATTYNIGALGLTLTPSGTTLPGSTLVRRVTGTALSGVNSHQSVQRYFDIQPTVNSGLNVNMVFNYFNHELNGISTANLALFKSTTGTSGPWLWQRPVTFGTNTVSRNGITDFSIWTLGNAASPLPVELSVFTATAEAADGRLRWSTASEKNNDRFEVEASTDGVAYTKLGTVAGHGTTATPQEYTFLDRNLARYAAAKVYYRLKQVDADGTETYSPVRMLAVAAGSQVASLVVFPTVVTSEAAVRYTYTGPALMANATLELLDVTGRRVGATRSGVEALGTVSVQGLASGWYLVRLHTATGTYQARFYHP